MTGKKFGLLALMAVTLIFPFWAHSQGGATGAITGAVVDGQGVPVSNAQIEIILAGSDSAIRTVLSDANGNFTAASLPVGGL